MSKSRRSILSWFGIGAAVSVAATPAIAAPDEPKLIVKHDGNSFVIYLVTENGQSAPIIHVHEDFVAEHQKPKPMRFGALYFN